LVTVVITGNDLFYLTSVDNKNMLDNPYHNPSTPKRDS